MSFMPIPNFAFRLNLWVISMPRIGLFYIANGQDVKSWSVQT